MLRRRERGLPKCSDPVQGPTEIEKHSQLDMGLSDEDIKELTIEWDKTMSAVQTAHLKHNAYTWSLIAPKGPSCVSAWRFLSRSGIDVRILLDGRLGSPPAT